MATQQLLSGWDGGGIALCQKGAKYKRTESIREVSTKSIHRDRRVRLSKVKAKGKTASRHHPWQLCETQRLEANLSTIPGVPAPHVNNLSGDRLYSTTTFLFFPVLMVPGYTPFKETPAPGLEDYKTGRPSSIIPLTVVLRVSKPVDCLEATELKSDISIHKQMSHCPLEVSLSGSSPELVTQPLKNLGLPGFRTLFGGGEGGKSVDKKDNYSLTSSCEWCVCVCVCKHEGVKKR